MRYVTPALLLALSACGGGPETDVDTPDAANAMIDSPANSGLDSARAQNDERRTAAGLDRQTTPSGR